MKTYTISKDNIRFGIALNGSGHENLCDQLNLKSHFEIYEAKAVLSPPISNFALQLFLLWIKKLKVRMQTFTRFVQVLSPPLLKFSRTYEPNKPL